MEDHISCQIAYVKKSAPIIDAVCINGKCVELSGIKRLMAFLLPPQPQ